MKFLILPALLASLVSPTLAGPDERVAEIRGWYNTVQKSEPTAERKIAFEAKSDPLGGDFTAREYDGGLKAVTVSYTAGDHAGIAEHYYFKDGTLFFAYVVSTSWQFAPGSTDDRPKSEDTRTEDRYYYDGGTCVRRLTRSATSGDADKLPAMVAKLEQKQIEPGHEAKDHRERAAKLAAAKTDTDILAAYGVE